MIFPGTRMLLSFTVVALLSGGPALAQAQGGRITGTVRGERGGVVRGASVTATNQATGASRVTATAGDGGYTLTGLTPGTYTVSASLVGQRRATKQNVQVVESSYLQSLQQLQLLYAGLEETVGGPVD